VGWRWGYLAPVPICLFSVLVFLLRARPKLAQLQKERAELLKAKKVDLLGSGLLVGRMKVQATDNQMLSITLFMLVVNLGGDKIPWSSPFIPALLVTASLSSFIFLRHEQKVPMPVLPMSLVNSRHMLSQVGLNLFGAMAVFGVGEFFCVCSWLIRKTLYFIPIYFETVLLTSASIASRRLLYPTLTAPIGSILTGVFLHNHRDKAYICQRLGTVVLLGGTISMFTLTFEKGAGRSELWFISRLIWVHMGMGILFISSLLDILSSTGTGERCLTSAFSPPENSSDHASATSLIFLIRSVGMVVGISGSQAVMQNVLLSQLTSRIVGPGSPKVSTNCRVISLILADHPRNSGICGLPGASRC
jgi:hypothetical protein